MDLSELEVIAGRLLEEQKRLHAIESELSMLKQEIREMPRRTVKDKSFYALIGLNYEEPGHGNREGELKVERDNISKTIKEAQGQITIALASQGLVIPLDPNATVVGNTFTFKFRSQATFPKTMEELSELLGITIPLVLGPVMIFPDKIVATEADQYFAKEKIVEAFDNIRKAVNLRLTQRQ